MSRHSTADLASLHSPEIKGPTKDQPDSPRAESRYDLFISVAEEDVSWAEELKKRLEVETFGDRPLRVFVYTETIELGDNFVLRINDEILEARYLAVVLTPAGVESQFVRLEWSTGIVRDPGSKQKRILPLLLKDCNIPALLRPLSRLDFRSNDDFEREYTRLAAKLTGNAGGIPKSDVNGDGLQPVPDLSGAFEPDAVPENLESNLYALTEGPASWFHVRTDCRLPEEVYARVRGGPVPPFIIKEGRIYSFADLTASRNPLRAVIDLGNMIEEETPSSVGNPNKYRWYVELLNRCVKTQLYHQGITFDRKHRRFFFLPPKEGNQRTETWHSGQRQATRTVADTKEAQDGTVLHWRHRAARIKFTHIGDSILLQIEPSWTFTKDGREALEGRRLTRLVTRKTSRERNNVVLNEVRFWAHIVAQGNTSRIKILTGGAPLVITRVPAKVSLSVGIWGDDKVPDAMMEPPETMREDGEEDPYFGFEDGDEEDDEEDDA